MDLDIKTLNFLEGKYCIHLMVYLVIQQETKMPPKLKITNKIFTPSFNFLHSVKPPKKWLKNYIKKNVQKKPANTLCYKMFSRFLLLTRFY